MNTECRPFPTFAVPMDEIDCIEYRETSYFSEMICDYLDQKPALKGFYHRFPSLENFKDQIEEKSRFPIAARQLVSDILQKQYELLNVPYVSTEKVEENILKLQDENTFTVVTGHQLNIFTGPLYFIYKIVSTVNLAKRLKQEYPQYNFVPVYWMASEDHDFEEINFINLRGGRLRWERGFGGPVGRMKTAGMESVIDELARQLGPGSNSERLTALFRKSYLEHETLADATRYLAHHLFGTEGLVILDGDDAALKRPMIPHFESDLFEHIPQKKVEETTASLEALHFRQVHPREINLFYVRDDLRERIIKKDDKWTVANTELSFSETELREELRQYPGRFSPNVVLRPLFQEVILPNLAYIGGGGELAYWFQLKAMFETMKIPFPVLVLRNSVLWIPQKWQKKMEQLELSTAQLFSPLHELQKKYVQKNAPVDTGLSPYEQRLQQMFNELEEVAQLTDKSMLGAVNAQRQKQLNGLEKLKKKLIKAEKRRQSTRIEKLDRLYYSLFPGNALQERHDNLSLYYCEYGEEFIDTLLQKLDPLDFRFTVIKA